MFTREKQKISYDVLTTCNNIIYISDQRIHNNKENPIRKTFFNEVIHLNCTFVFTVVC